MSLITFRGPSEHDSSTRLKRKKGYFRGYRKPENARASPLLETRRRLHTRNLAVIENAEKVAGTVLRGYFKCGKRSLARSLAVIREPEASRLLKARER